VAASSVYAEGRPPAFGRDFHLAYLTDWLAFAGIEVHAVVPLWRTRPDDTLASRRADALAAARRAAEGF
jgi:FMN-dependent NADH-azoreductase